METIFPAFISSFITGFGVWFWQNYKTKRDLKKIDFDNLNNSFEQMLGSQKNMMDQNNILVRELVEKNGQIISLQNQVNEMKSQIQKLEIKIQKLERS